MLKIKNSITSKYSKNNLMREMCCYEYSWDAHADLDNPENTPEEWPCQSKREKEDA